jgi:hypothetical protein
MVVLARVPAFAVRSWWRSPGATSILN